MSRVLQPITSCLKKPQLEEHENDATEKGSNKKEDQNAGDSNAGLLWRMSSRVYNLGSGAVGLGVSGVKLAASTTYTVGTGVVSATQSVVSKIRPSSVPKPKKE